MTMKPDRRRLTQNSIDITEIIGNTSDKSTGQICEAMSDQFSIQLDVIFSKRHAQSRYLFISIDLIVNFYSHLEEHEEYQRKQVQAE